MATGTVSAYDDRTGRGYISPDSGDGDVLVHHSSIQMEGFRTLRVGERVEFEVIDDPKGLRARNVVRLGDGGEPPELRRPRERRGRSPSS